MKFLSASIVLACITLCIAPAQAQAPSKQTPPKQTAPKQKAYPSKPITIVVTLAAGGAADVVTRAVAKRLTDEWGQPVIIENRGGANTLVGAAAVSKAAPDGYTLLVTAEHTFTVNPHLYRTLPYDPAKDFVPVSGLVSISQALVVHPSLRLQNIGDLVALAKMKPGELTYGSLGVGSGPHLSMAMLESMTETKLTPVQYKGAAPALTDVIAGHIPMMFVSTGLIVQPWKAGQLGALGVGSHERLPELPELPAIAETLPGFTARVWFGLFAPKGTPKEIATKLNASVQRILSDPAFRERVIAPNFYEPMAGSPAQLAERIRTDTERWRKVINDAKIAIQD